ncbi:MAG: DUF3748 domain-containing protein [Verrucomicrobiales bacterium]|nr:DUF3748 domain-containing protein [Verrucomicrobiales bacterium]
MLTCAISSGASSIEEPARYPVERQITRAAHGHILTNTGVWSPDSQWIAYDVRSDAAGEVFDGEAIEAVHLGTGDVRTLYRSRDGAKCGVVTFHPSNQSVVFIHGPAHPTPEWSYGPFHRQGALVDWERPGTCRVLDARDLVAPYTPGALRGGSHVHVYSPDGTRVSFTYEDHVLATRTAAEGEDLNQRNIGVTVLGRPVRVGSDHARNHDGEGFSVLVTRTTNRPRPGSDEIQKAFEEGWVGVRGYLRADGTRQRHALAFQGHVVTETGAVVAEVFIVDLPEDLTQPGEGPLAGTSVRRPSPPAGVVQRRLTHTTTRKYPGIQGPRHWLRCSGDGEHIAFLAKDEAGDPQLHLVSPRGGAIRQLTRHAGGVTSAFTWSPDSRRLVFHAGGRVCFADLESGRTTALTARRAEARQDPRQEACVISPDGQRVAYVRRVPAEDGREFNQVFVVDLPTP